VAGMIDEIIMQEVLQYEPKYGETREDYKRTGLNMSNLRRLVCLYRVVKKIKKIK
jgi:hypothetical protein